MSSPDVLHIFPAFGEGGAEVRTCELINQTHGSVRHAVLSISNVLTGRSRISAGVEVPCSTAESGSVLGLRMKIAAQRPSAVFTYGWGGVDAIIGARLAGVRHVMHHEDGFLPDERAGEKRVRQLARRVAFRFARKVVVPSLTLMEIGRRGWRLPKKHLLYIPNGVDTKRFHPVTSRDHRNAIRRELGLPVDGLIAGTVGRLRPEKNQLRLVTAFGAVSQRVPDAHLVIVGDGPLEEPMREEAERLGITDRVHFCGDQPDPAPYYRVMDLFVLSSDTEQMPLSLLEAMATRLPVVSTDVGDVGSLVAEENRGLIVPLGNEQLFSDMLIMALSDPALLIDTARANLNRCLSAYAIDQMVEKHFSLYEEAVKQKTGK